MRFVLKEIKKRLSTVLKIIQPSRKKSIPSRFSTKHIELLCISQRALLKRLAYN